MSNHSVEQGTQATALDELGGSRSIRGTMVLISVFTKPSTPSLQVGIEPRFTKADSDICETLPWDRCLLKVINVHTAIEDRQGLHYPLASYRTFKSLTRPKMMRWWDNIRCDTGHARKASTYWSRLLLFMFMDSPFLWLLLPFDAYCVEARPRFNYHHQHLLHIKSSN